MKIVVFEMYVYVYTLMSVKAIICISCVIIRLACHYSTQFPPSPIPLFSYLFHYSSGCQGVCNFVSGLLFHFYFLIVDRLLCLFFSFMYCLISPWDNIYLLFLKMALWCCNAPYTTHF